MTHEEFSDSLRKIADFYDRHPEVPLPHIASEGLSIYNVTGLDQMRIVARAFVKETGNCDKETNDTMFHVSARIGALKIYAVDYRENVCERAVVGTKKVTKKVATGYREETVEEPIVEWRCPETLLTRESK